MRVRPLCYSPLQLLISQQDQRPLELLIIGHGHVQSVLSLTTLTELVLEAWVKGQRSETHPSQLRKAKLQKDSILH